MLGDKVISSFRITTGKFAVPSLPVMANFTSWAGLGVFLFAVGVSLLVRAIQDTTGLGSLIGGFAGILLGFGLLLIGRETRR